MKDTYRDTETAPETPDLIERSIADGNRMGSGIAGRTWPSEGNPHDECPGHGGGCARFDQLPGVTPTPFAYPDELASLPDEIQVVIDRLIDEQSTKRTAEILSRLFPAMLRMRNSRAAILIAQWAVGLRPEGLDTIDGVAAALGACKSWISDRAASIKKEILE